MVPHVEFIRVENHVVRCLRVERFLDFRVRRHADVREDEEEEKEVEELVRNGVKKEFSPHFRVFLNNARTRSGERRTNFLTEESREGREAFYLLLAEKTKTNFRLPESLFSSSFFLSFFLRISFYVYERTLERTAFFWTFTFTFKTLLL